MAEAPADSPASRKRSRWDADVDDEPTPTPGARSGTGGTKRSRWDAEDATPTPAGGRSGTGTKKSRWDADDATPTPAGGRSGTGTKKSRWDADDATPTPAGGRSGTGTKKNRWDADEATPTPAHRSGKSRWGEEAATPTPGTRKGRWGEGDVTPGTAKRSRWDNPEQTPTPAVGSTPTPGQHGTPATVTPSGTQWGQATGATPTPTAMTPGFGAATPMTPAIDPTLLSIQKDLGERNREMTDADLDALLPEEGYVILPPPEGYERITTPGRKYTSTPTPGMFGAGFSIGEETPLSEQTGTAGGLVDVPRSLGENLPDLKPDDFSFFGPLLDGRDEEELNPEELRTTVILKLLLRIKNGTPPQRKSALRRLTDKAREFGAEALFDHILPLMMSPTLEDQERHLIVKVIDRILFKLGDMVRPYVHKILVVIEPMLIDEDYYARIEGREIISNLSKAAGLAAMIKTMRPDIDNVDEFVRNVTARAFAVVASALGIGTLIPFLKAVCQSKKSWQPRHTGTKIVQQIAILMGCAVLPHLKDLVELISPGLRDDQQKVRTITALALSALAEASAPYGVEAFDCVLEPLWTGIHQHRGKGLAAFLKAIGYIIPLMEDKFATYYTKEVSEILIREFKSPDDEMKKIVLKVIRQCVKSMEVEYIEKEMLPLYCQAFWVKRMALSRNNYKEVVTTTVSLAQRIGSVAVIKPIVEDLKDENESYRRMVMEAIQLIVEEQGMDDIDANLQEQLIDGSLYAFQEQSPEDNQVILVGFATIVNGLGKRARQYLPQIATTIKWHLNNKEPKVRQQAADLAARLAVTMKKCEEEQQLLILGQVLYEYLGEEYPEVLGSILSAMKSIVSVVGMARVTPPIKDLLPRLKPILTNRNEKVQENCIDLVGRIADRGHDYVNEREWMRICQDLLELLKAHKKAIRRAAVNTFAYIAKAVGPSDVLVTLLNNLKVQERQLRVCTTVAIAIVAETCGPFTVLPALMNEYRVQELNVQNGVLKAMSFLFECIGEMGKDYIYAVLPLLEDALIERDHVHRQIACNVVKHMCINVTGFGCEDASQHLLNYIWPNIFETSPHVINSVFEAIEGIRLSLGPTAVLQYILQGLYHPARKVREVFWKLYNNVYIGHADSLISSYPRMENELGRTYARTELDYFV